MEPEGERAVRILPGTFELGEACSARGGDPKAEGVTGPEPTPF